MPLLPQLNLIIQHARQEWTLRLLEPQEGIHVRAYEDGDVSSTRELGRGKRALHEDWYGAGVWLWFALGRGREGRVRSVLEAGGIALGLDSSEELEDLRVSYAVAGARYVEEFFGLISDSQCCDY